MKRILSFLLTITILISLCGCNKTESAKEYYSETTLENLETFSSITGVEVSIVENAPESNSIIYNYLMDNDANGLGAITKYEAYLREYGFEKSEGLSNAETATYLMDDYIIITGNYLPQSNVLQYVISIPSEKTDKAELSDSTSVKQEIEPAPEPEPQPEKDVEAVYSEVCQLVNDKKYTEAIDLVDRESIPLDYADTEDYYYYAKAMEYYVGTEFLLYQRLQKVVKWLTNNVQEGFKDSNEILNSINSDLDRLIGHHVWTLDSTKVYLAYHLIINDNGEVALELQSEKDDDLAGRTTHQLVYVNVENGSYYMLCGNSHLDINHCEYGITIQDDCITLSKAWGGGQDIFAESYTKIA